MTQRRILLDTGVIVAALNQRDPDHVRVVEWLVPVRASWFTTEGVLVEASHLLRKTPSAVARVVQFVAALRCAVMPLSPSRLARAVEIVEAHHSLRLDLVDAVLCALSEETENRRTGFPRSPRFAGRATAWSAAFSREPAARLSVGEFGDRRARGADGEQESSVCCVMQLFVRCRQRRSVESGPCSSTQSPRTPGGSLSAAVSSRHRLMS